MTPPGSCEKIGKGTDSLTVAARNVAFGCYSPSIFSQVPAGAFAIREQDYEVSRPNQLSGTERRSKVRYPIPLKIRYRALGQPLRSGEGQAVNLSSSGALVISPHELRVGAELEIYMEWPSLLDGWIPLQLVAQGSVVRCGASNFAVCFRRHQFRTLGSKLQTIAPSGPGAKMPPGSLARRVIQQGAK